MKKFSVLTLMLLLVTMLPIMLACGGSDDNDDIVEVQEPQVSLNASHLTEYGYFDGMLYYKIISNSTQEVAVVKAEENAVKVAIPSQVNIEGKSYRCTKIENGAFKKLEAMTSVTIPNSITVIGESAFSGCKSLTSVNIPNGVTDIGRGTFSSCSSLTSIKIPNSVTSIGSNAFSGSSALTSITIPNSVTSIGLNAFHGCSALTSVIVQSGNNIYDSREDCNAIIETATNTLIYGCNNTTIPNSVTSIGDFAFHDCYGLTSVTIPNSVTSIGEFAFNSCSGLTSVTISNSVTSIGSAAFCYCDKLEKVVSLIENPFEAEHVFSDRTYNKAILYVPIGTKKKYMSTPGWYSFGQIVEDTSDLNSSYTEGIDGIYVNQASSDRNGIAYGQNIEVVVTDNGDGTVTFEDVLGGWYAIRSGFGDNYKMSATIAVTKDGTLKLIDSYVPSWGDGLDSFEGSYDANNDIITFTCVYAKMKYTETWVKKDQVDDIIGEIFEKDGIHYKIGMNNTVSVASGNTKYSGDIAIPSQVTYNNKTYNITRIASDAFLGCSNLTAVSIPNSVTSIGGDAFWGCESLTSITIPERVDFIGQSAFGRCSNLKAVYISDLKAFLNIHFMLGDYADCNPLFYAQHLYLNGEEIIDLTIPSDITIINKCTFVNCSSIKSIYIPNSVSEIGEDAFDGCSGLTSITIPNSVSHIHMMAFSNCNGLTSISIPNSVESIDIYAFSGCSSLTTIVSEIEKPFKIDNSVFNGVPSDAQLIVPKGTKEKYQTTEGWKDFANIVEDGS